NGCLGSRIHHEHVRPELLQGPGKVLAICVLGDERKKIEIALRVAHHAFEIVDLKEAQITMIILDAFLLKVRALLRCELVGLAFVLAAVGAATLSVEAVAPATTIGLAGDTSAATVCMMEDAIDSFIRFLAVERGLSENYQLSTQRSLSDFAHWCAASKKIDNPHAVT